MFYRYQALFRPYLALSMDCTKPKLGTVLHLTSTQCNVSYLELRGSAKQNSTSLCSATRFGTTMLLKRLFARPRIVYNLGLKLQYRLHYGTLYMSSCPLQNISQVPTKTISSFRVDKINSFIKWSYVKL